ncbi:MAG: carboxyl-terminal protease family protein [Fibrobacteres bacterium]|nr:carboxyl-terminal protease family protein [Fibrobacterota bacterium]
MTDLRFPFRNVTACLVLGLALWLAGCLFDAKYPDPADSTQSYSTVNLDTLYPAGAAAESVVTLFQPFQDPSLGSGGIGPKEALTPVNVKDHVTGKVVQYRLTRQRFGSWDAGLEFKWNYFLLKSNFLFAADMPDTSGMENSSPTLFQRVHALDSFTNYFDSVDAPRIWARITTSTKPGAVGVAVRLSAGKDSVVIQQVVANSPAGRAGLSAGMVILSVNDSVTVGDSAIERFSRFSGGDSGSTVKLEVTGPGSNGPKTFNLVREPVAFPTVMVDSIQGIGYLSISGFTPNTVDSKSTYTELRDGLLATRGFPVTILDLRDNGGGSLDVAMKMCDEILPADIIIIRQLQRRFDESAHAPLESEITAVATAGGVGEKAPDGSRRKYLLLGNGHSASASEIFLVSIREGADAPLMGIKTYGKGVGQTVRNTPAKGLSLVTFLKFTSRSKLDYHLHGLVPDYPDSSDSDSLLAHAAQKALAMAGRPAAKVSAASGYDVSRQAAAVEWNRRQGIRPGVTDLEELR